MRLDLIAMPRKKLDLEKLRAVEAQLRSHRLETSVETVRRLVREHAILLSWRNARGQKAAAQKAYTRSHGDVNEIQKLLNAYQKSYNWDRDALKLLSHPVTCREMKNKDIDSNGLETYFQLGQKSRELSWIWTTRFPDPANSQLVVAWHDYSMCIK